VHNQAASLLLFFMEIIIFYCENHTKKKKENTVWIECRDVDLATTVHKSANFTLFTEKYKCHIWK